MISEKKQNCYLIIENYLLIFIGTNNLVIIDTNDETLIAYKNESESKKNS